MYNNIVSIVGKSGSGKTTLIEKLIIQFKKRGYRVGSVKHAHNGFEMDRKGKDSWRLKKAGSDATLVISPERIALIKDHRTDARQQIETHLYDMDIILVEGFKSGNFPKIEIFRTGIGHTDPLCPDDEDLQAFVTDAAVIPADVPVFQLNDITGICAFIESRFIESRFLNIKSDG